MSRPGRDIVLCQANELCYVKYEYHNARGGQWPVQGASSRMDLGLVT